MIQQVVALAEKRKIEPNEEQLAVSESLLKMQLKAMIAQRLWDTNEYFRVMDKRDKILIKAIEVINSKN